MTAARRWAELHITCCRDGKGRARRPLVMETSPWNSCSSSSKSMEAASRTWKPRSSGGACMFEAFRAEDGSDDHIGSRNIKVALHTFSRLGIVIAARDTGGENGRKIKMQSDTG